LVSDALFYPAEKNQPVIYVVKPSRVTMTQQVDARDRRELTMEKPKAKPIAGLLLTLLVALLIFGVVTFARPCDSGDQGEMSCLWASRVVIGVGAVAAILAIVRIFETDEGERRGLSLSVGLLGFLIAALPGPIIGLCGDPSMHCNAVMRPFVLVVGVAMGVIGAVDLVRRLLAIRKR